MNVKEYKIKSGENKISEVLNQKGTLVQRIGKYEIFNYCSGTVIKENHHLKIGGSLEVSVNHVSYN